MNASEASAYLASTSAFLDDIETVRIATQNRIRAIEDDWKMPQLADAYRPQLKALKDVEHQAALQLQRVVRQHPLGPWIKATHGVGEKQGARLIAAIRDPYIRPPMFVDGVEAEPSRPRRGPAELWAYCGFVPGQRRRKGERANWNPVAKSRAYLVAEACLKAKAKSPYGPLYDAERAKHEHVVHAEPCAQCGTKGNPAPAGSPLRDGHKHARALRRVAKEILKDLFLEARELGC